MLASLAVVRWKTTIISGPLLHSHVIFCSSFTLAFGLNAHRLTTTALLNSTLMEFWATHQHRLSVQADARLGPEATT